MNEEASIQVAENELAGLAEVGAIDQNEIGGLLEMFGSEKHKDRLGAVNAVQGLKGRVALQMQQEEAELNQRNIESQIGLREAQAEAQTASIVSPEDKTRKLQAEAEKQRLDILKAQTDLEASKVKLAQATSPAEQKKLDLSLKKAENEIKLQEQSFVKGNKKLVDEQRGVINAAIDAGEKFDDISGAIDEIIRVVEEQNDLFPATGGRGEVIRFLPFTTSTDAGKVGELVKRIKGDAAFSALKDIKKSGATLGAVSNQELALLESQAGTLNPDLSRDDFVKQLNDFRETRRRAVSAIAADLESQGLAIPPAVSNALNASTAAPKPQAQQAGERMIISSIAERDEAQRLANESKKPIAVTDASGNMGFINPSQ